MHTCELCNRERETVDVCNVAERGTSIPMQVCDDCRDDAIECCSCEVLITTTIPNEANDEYYCGSCFEELVWCCDDCGEEFDRRRDEPADTRGNGMLCACCWDDVSFTCIQCGNRRHVDCLNENAHGREICDCCEVRSEPSSIKNYTYNPPEMFFIASSRELKKVARTKMPFLKKDDSRLLFLGVELEMGNYNYTDEPDRMYARVEEKCSLFYGKRDSSIPGGGWEMVTHPHTLEAHKLGFNWEHAFDVLEPNYELDDECGIHIHVNRTFFGLGRKTRMAPHKTVEIKLASLISTTKDNWCSIAEREHSEYAEVKPVLCAADVLMNHRIKNGGRYSAVNFHPENTIEFRFNKSTFDIGMFYAKLEHIDALCRYVKQAPLSKMCQGTKSWDWFMEWVEEQSGSKKTSGRYAHLLNEW